VDNYFLQNCRTHCAPFYPQRQDTSCELVQKTHVTVVVRISYPLMRISRAEEVLGVADCMDMGSVSYSEVYASV